jgi:hypothetical protein
MVLMKIFFRVVTWQYSRENHYFPMHVDIFLVLWDFLP